MSKIIKFSSNELVNNGFNNSFRYDFRGSAINFTDAEIAVNAIQVYNSLFNIDSDAYGNNTFSIVVPTGASTSTVNVVLRDGYYSYSDINRQIQTALVGAGAYLIDANGNNVFYIQITENLVYYSAQVDLSSTPTALPTGYSKPVTGLYSNSGTGLPTTAYTPQLIVGTNFGKIIGFTQGTYPSALTSTTQTFLSNTIPTVNPVSSYMLRCSMISNEYSNPPDVMTVFSTQGTSAGQLIDYKPNGYLWLSITDGAYSSITITIVDQNENFVRFHDRDALIVLAIRKKTKK